jgi:glycosyltransferase-like protein
MAEKLQAEKLRIALLTYSTKPRGSVIHTLELANALHHLGQDVCIYALDKDGQGFDWPLACAYHAVPAQTAPPEIDRLIRQRIQEFVEELSQWIPTQPYDCYHAQDCISANALLMLRQQGQIPHFIRTVHHIDQFNNPYLQDCQTRSILEPDQCLCVSQIWQTQLQQQYGIDAFRVINGVDRDRFAQADSAQVAALKRALGLTGYPIYLTVGGIEPRKNSIALLQAFAQVRRHFPQAQLVIAGGATLFDYQPYREQFFTEVRHHNLAEGDALILPGVIADGDLPALYQSANAFVFPSVKEGWGLVVLEAIAAGLPVITANQTPFTEFLTSQQALLVNPGDVNAIAEAMLEGVQPSVAQSLVAHSQSVCETYTWEASARLHLSHYRQLLQRFRGDRSFNSYPCFDSHR